MLSSSSVQFSYNSISTVRLITLLNIKCPLARGDSCKKLKLHQVTEWRKKKKTWEKPDSVGGAVLLWPKNRHGVIMILLHKSEFRSGSVAFQYSSSSFLLQYGTHTHKKKKLQKV